MYKVIRTERGDDYQQVVASFETEKEAIKYLEDLVNDVNMVFELMIYEYEVVCDNI